MVSASGLHGLQKEECKNQLFSKVLELNLLKMSRSKNDWWYLPA
jgi:hypothetical protein